MIVVVLLCVTAYGWAQTKPASPPDTWPDIHKAVDLIGQKQFAQAGEMARAIIKTDPAQPMGYALLVSVAQQTQDFAGVVKACDELAGAMPLNPKPKDEGLFTQHQFWNYYASRHKGEALFATKKYAEAAECFAAARKLAFDVAKNFDASQTARWQILTGNRQADALWEAGEIADSIALREELLAKFDKDWQACNNCVRVKAAMARSYQVRGDSEKAKAIVDAVAADKRLDDVQKSWLVAQVEGKAWQAPKAGDKLVSFEAPQSFVIRCEGRWEMRVDLTDKGRYGPIGQFYDLENDPLREHNLLTTSYFPLLKPHHVGYLELRDGKWQAIDYDRYTKLKDKIDVGQDKQQNTFGVIEATPARVRCGYTHKSWPNETLIYTFYPDGRLYVGSHWSLMHPDKDVKITEMGFYLGVNGTTNWRTTIGKLTGMLGEQSIAGQAPFTMIHSNGDFPHFFDATRASLALGTRNPADMTGSYGNNCLPLAFFRTPVRVAFKPDETPEKDLAFLIHFWPNGRDTFQAELPYMEDFQNPAALTLAKGEGVKDDAGDFDKDGFNEAEGCYVVRPADGQVDLTIDGTKTPRYSPVFKVLGVKGGAVSVTMDGKALAEGREVATSVNEKTGVAVVRIIGPVTTAAKVSIAVK